MPTVVWGVRVWVNVLSSACAATPTHPPVRTRPRRCSHARPPGHAHHLSSYAHPCPATPNDLSGHAHPPALTRLPRSGHAHPSRPVTSIRLATPTCRATPTRPVEPRPPALSGHRHPPVLPLLPRSGHAHPVQPHPPCRATPAHPVWSRAAVLSSHAHPSVSHAHPCRATPTRPVHQSGAPLTLINAAIVPSRRCAVWRLRVVLSWLLPLRLERGNKDRAETLWLFQKIKYF